MGVMRNHRTLGQIFGAPLVVGVLSTIGLISALVGNGWWDAVSWVSLGLPVLMYVFFTLRRRTEANR